MTLNDPRECPICGQPYFTGVCRGCQYNEKGDAMTEAKMSDAKHFANIASIPDLDPAARALLDRMERMREAFQPDGEEDAADNLLGVLSDLEHTGDTNTVIYKTIKRVYIQLTAIRAAMTDQAKEAL